MARSPSSVLFACTFNAIRSPMAEALLKHLHGRHIYVDSVGVREAEIDPFAVVVMDEIGIDISHHRSKHAKEYLGQGFPFLITLCDDANEHCPIFPGVRSA